MRRRYLSGGGQTADQVEQGVAMAGQAIGTVFPVAGAVIEIADQIASLFGTTHKEGQDYFIGLPANGGAPFVDNETPQSGTVSAQVGDDLVEILDQVFQSWQAQGAVLSNPILFIEIRDDGTPGMLFKTAAPMPLAQQEQYNIPGGIVGAPGWNDRDASQYWSLGPINQVQQMVVNLYNVFQAQGWIRVIPGAANTVATNVAPRGSMQGPAGSQGALVGSPNPTMPTVAQAASGVTAAVPPLVGAGISTPVMLGLALLAGVLLLD